MKLFDGAGGNITIDMVASSGYVAAMTDGDNIANATIDKTMVGRGQIVLTSDDGGIIKLTDNTVANSGLAKLGLEGQSEEQVSGTGGVNVSTLSGATSALANIDAAIETLSRF